MNLRINAIRNEAGGQGVKCVSNLGSNMRTLLLLLLVTSALLVPSMSNAKVRPKSAPQKQPSYVYGPPSITDDSSYLKGTNIPRHVSAPPSN
jgi:hypothetical protein